ncbi:sodium/calcium exchanger 3-like isoform X1 [Mytilus californianus]|uniref:sodium/calcium exchanger 3-like isoform X1 n=1 Tax=Mytilus californianus TaxID=6549 RepID=UPI002247EF68|nr:sodium/calcium exchanger 3-like isoform X1 [Mytilus californianus]XP_052106300.1 sodium/calcium exchanger 3-like isoform X1 [Mytilus californianus]XP_052106301.1 sodium/calcium exchanger 3-like isoform X1 [Mytilus californianus]
MKRLHLKMTKEAKMASILLGVFCIIEHLPVTIATNSTAATEECSRNSTPCQDGTLFKAWSPIHNLSPGDQVARAIVYFVSMIYLFLGVSIVADRFMAAIEVITSKEKEIVIKRIDGTSTTVNVRVWNETVSNLTLMALGSSAPEILLSVIEICLKNNFMAGELGPSTIVGSAAFNLFVIIAICVYCVPNGESRTIKHLRVFLLTATWSIFAYLWLYFILAVTSPGVIQIWEATLTLAFFPITVLTAYIADKKLYPYRFLTKRYRSGKHKPVMISSEGDGHEMQGGKMNNVDEIVFKGLDGSESDMKEIKEFEQHRKDYMDIIRELRKKHPNADMKQLEEMAELEAINRGPKSRAFYRIQATRKLTGGGNVIKKAKIERRASVEDVKVEIAEDNITRVFFDPGHYTVMENVGSFALTVSRTGGDLNKTLYVDFKTEDGTANAGSDYEHSEGTIVFYPLETHKQCEVTIIDDELFEEDEHFYVRLSNLRLGDSQGMFESGQNTNEAKLGTPHVATVMILDDDHPGIFHFDEKEMSVPEAIGEVEVKVKRSSGARGMVKIPYHTIDASAKCGKDFELVEHEIVFDNDETEKMIHIRIFDDEEYEKNEEFYLVLDEPCLLRKGSDSETEEGEEDKYIERNTEPLPNEENEELLEMGKPRLGDTTKINIHIIESYEFKNVVDKLLKKANVSLVVGTSSWREQFSDAITVSADSGASKGDEEDEESEEKLPSCMDYVMHFLTLFWKVMFAFIPPTDYFGGWACFCVSIIMVGLLTAVIGDLASGFGCTIGLKDSVTAISFVALGTSVPDTFASKVAAINDQYADSSIGNVTGSNAVNVFLGIGIAWTIAAIYHAANGNTFEVPPGDLALSVTVFCAEAAVVVIVMLVRRRYGGELGGPPKTKIITTVFFVSLWVIYLVLSSMRSYCYIDF